MSGTERFLTFFLFLLCEKSKNSNDKQMKYLKIYIVIFAMLAVCVFEAMLEK